MLDVLYAVCRGNRVFLKLSAIETQARTFDPRTRHGLEVPHDAQVILLDYNLTIPDKATQHIEAIFRLPCNLLRSAIRTEDLYEH